MASKVEEFELRLKETIAGPAAVARGAMGQLEAAIAAEQKALGGLEGKLATAAQKMQALGASTGGEKVTAAIERQKAAMAELEAQIGATKATMEGLEGLRGAATEADAAAAAASAEKEAAATAAVAEKAAAAAAAVAAKAAAEREAAAAAAQAEADADAAADAKLRILETSYQTAEAERKLADAARAAAGAVKEQEKQFKAAEAAAKEASDAEVKARQGQSEAVKKQTEHYKDLGKVLLVAAAAAVVLAVAFFKAAKSAILAADEEKKLDALSKKLGDNMKAIFGGLKIDKLLDGMGTLVDLFDENTASGRALKFLFEAIFQPLIDGIAAAIPMIERVFIITLIYATRAYIALVKFSRTDAFDNIVTGLKILGVVVGVSLGIFVAFIAVGIALIVAIGAAILYLVGLVVNNFGPAWDAVAGAAVGAWEAIKGAVSGALDWLAGISLVDVGVNLIMGLVNGIASSAGAVISAITGAVGGAIDSAKSLLGIASESKVFRQIGRWTGEGMGTGVEQGGEKAQGAIETMVAPPELGPRGIKAAAKTAAAQGGAGKVVYIEKLVLGAREQWGEFREFLRGEFEVEVLAGDLEEPV